MRIDKPGLYDLPLEAYHADACDGPSISASGLSQLLFRSPAHYWASSPLNPRAQGKTTRALDLGRAAHARTIGEPLFNQLFVIAPYDDFRGKEARAWRDAETRTIIRAQDYDTILSMAAALSAHPYARNAFVKGHPEKSVFWRDEETGIWLKARPDWLPTDQYDYIKDYKTTVSAAPRQFASAAFSYGYHIQAALILDGLKAVTGTEYPGVALVAQEKEPPYVVELYCFGADHIDYARAQIRQGLRLFARCLARKDWPSYHDEPQMIGTPGWVGADMDNPKWSADNERCPDADEISYADALAAG